jgi:hypothetical protein
MRLLLDTEFTDFNNPDLISIGLVSECGKHEFYIEVSDYDVKSQSDFVRDVVVPLLTGQSATYEECGHKLVTWLESLGKNFEIVIDYSGDGFLMAELIRTHEHNLTIVYNYQSKILSDLAKLETLLSNDDTFYLTTGIHDKVVKALKVLSDVQDAYFNDTDKKIHNALTDAKAMQQGWKAALKIIRSNNHD